MRALLLLVTLATVATAQSEKHGELGLTFTPPPDMERIPVRARDRFGVLAYVERGESGTPASFDLYLVPRDGGLDEGVTDARSFVVRELHPTEAEALRVGRRRYGHEPARWRLTLEGGALAGWVHAWEGPERSYVFVGRCEPDELADHEESWERSAESVRLYEPRDDDARRRRWERYYAGRRGLVGIERRIQARLTLIDGWAARDSEHYIVLLHGADLGFVEGLIGAVENLRDEFAELCPPDGVLDEVSTVRICRDEEEYLAYGGWEGSVGYWSPGEEELVLFDARETVDPELDGEHYTRAVLFHEAFHQYVHYAAEGVAPHPWFDEGLAEYFGGARMDGRRFLGVEPNRYRLPVARALAREGAYPWEGVTGFEQSEFYADSGRLYPQAWSMVHFLASSPTARRHRRWSAILPAYFRALRAGWTVERRRLTGGGSVEDARRRARERARAKAFEGVDWDELEEAWRRHVAGLETPEAR